MNVVFVLGDELKHIAAVVEFTVKSLGIKSGIYYSEDEEDFLEADVLILDDTVDSKKIKRLSGQAEQEEIAYKILKEKNLDAHIEKVAALLVEIKQEGAGNYRSRIYG